MSNKIVGVRFETSDKLLLEKVARARGGNVSDFVRLAVRRELARLSFFTDEEKKALGIKPEAPTTWHDEPTWNPSNEEACGQTDD
jgi:hypothetical protein